MKTVSIFTIILIMLMIILMMKRLEKEWMKLQMKVINFACSEKMITTASKYLKVFPILASVKISLNIPREGQKERSAMLWHKDDLGYKSMDFVAFATDVDDDNGPFYTLKKKNPLCWIVLQSKLQGHLMTLTS